MHACVRHVASRARDAPGREERRGEERIYTFEIATIESPRQKSDGRRYNNNRRESVLSVRAILLFQRLSFSSSSSSFSRASSRRFVHVAHVRYARFDRARHVGRCAHCATDTTRFTPVRPSVCPLVRRRHSGHKCPQEERYRSVRLGPPGRQNPPAQQGRIQSFTGSPGPRLSGFEAEPRAS